MAGGNEGQTGVTVQLDQTHQTIEGFGFNTALSTGTVPWDTAFSTTGKDGIGLSIVRVAMSSNGSLSGDVSGAKSHGVKVLGSAWTPPANCEDNNNTQKGGHLKTSCYDSYSTTIANFAKNQGLYAMSAANEPDLASCGSTIGPPCNALTVGEASAWLYWWYKAVGSDDNEGLLLKTSSGLTKRHYTLGNYSKFVRPGYTRVDLSGSVPTNVLLSAYKGTDGTVVVVAINKGTAAATVPISISGGTAPASCTPNVTRPAPTSRPGPRSR